MLSVLPLPFQHQRLLLQMVCLTLLFFNICIFWCFKFVPYCDITYSPFIFLAPEITTTDGMFNVNIFRLFYIPVF